MPCTYARVVGDGRVYQGAAILYAVIFQPISADDYADIYDGLDATSGEVVFRTISSAVITWHVSFPQGVRLNHGIYIDGKDDAVETTVFFQPLEL